MASENRVVTNRAAFGSKYASFRAIIVNHYLSTHYPTSSLEITN